MTKTLFFIRHGETDWNVEERFQGHIDIPLNEKGRSQALQLVPALEKNAVEALLSSDLSRAVETAQIVASKLSLPVFQDPGLREAFLGQAQGMTRVEIEASFGLEVTQRWRSSRMSDADISYPGGETGNEIMKRTFGALQGFLDSHAEYSRIAVVTHGGVIRRVMQKLLPPESPAVPIPNTVVYAVEFEPETGIFKVL